MEATETAKWEMIEAGGRTAQSFGLSRLFGQIFILLYLSPEPLCLDAMTRALGVSKASLSITCRQLEAWGALKRCWRKGDRRDYYQAVSDLGTILNNGLMASMLKKLDSAKLQIERSLELLGDDQGAGTGFVQGRLLEAERYRNRVEKVLRNPILKKML